VKRSAVSFNWDKQGCTVEFKAPATDRVTPGEIMLTVGRDPCAVVVGRLTSRDWGTE